LDTSALYFEFIFNFQGAHMKTKIMALFVSGLSIGSALAQSSAPPSPGKNPGVDAALAACAASSAKDTSGKPNPNAMDACMTAKGFSKPSSRPGNGGPPPK
jgi:hypothetical protein